MPGFFVVQDVVITQIVQYKMSPVKVVVTFSILNYKICYFSGFSVQDLVIFQILQYKIPLVKIFFTFQILQYKIIFQICQYKICYISDLAVQDAPRLVHGWGRQQVREAAEVAGPEPVRYVSNQKKKTFLTLDVKKEDKTLIVGHERHSLLKKKSFLTNN